MKITQVAKIIGGQDGAIWKDELFRFDDWGHGVVYNLKELKKDTIVELSPVAEFVLDKADLIAPHSNAVFFGTEYFDVSDEYPLLYSNVYNNYEGCEEKLVGVCCVYRIERYGKDYKTTLVQLIKIGFHEEAPLWKLSDERHGVRRWGNFVLDRETGELYVFVMKDIENGTRYFKFKCPSVFEGERDPVYNVKKVVLEKSDLIEYFDCKYHHYIQGATVHEGLIYSAEGFLQDEVNRPAIRIIDPRRKEEICYLDLIGNGYKTEPEIIDFYNGKCIYGDVDGNLYKINFDINEREKL